MPRTLKWKIPLYGSAVLGVSLGIYALLYGLVHRVVPWSSPQAFLVDFLLLCLLLASLLLPLFLYGRWRIVEPLVQLARLHAAVARGELDARYYWKSQDEIGSLVASFNGMVDELLRDPLTGLLNRRKLAASLKHEMERSRRYNRPLSLIMVDIDHFKQVNDRYGHQVGDEVLRALASTLIKESRSVDQVARWGGEEFLLLLPETELGVALEVAERLRRTVTELSVPVHGGGGVKFKISLGAAAASLSDSVDSLIARADAAMYVAKERGRDQVAVLSYDAAVGVQA